MKRILRLVSGAVLTALLICFIGVPSRATGNTEDIVLPDDLEVIEELAFYGDSSIGSVHLGEHVRRIESKAFANSSLSQINLPDSLEFIAEDAFSASGNLRILVSTDSPWYAWAYERGFLVVDPASTQYPESEHPYANNSDLSWTYVYPANAEGLLVTFSKDTETEAYYDTLSVIDADGITTECTGKQLSGVTLTLPGNSFTLHLESDGSVNAYGFRIVDISPVQHNSLYPESEHPYADDMDLTWTYVHPTDAEGLLVTFSSDTETEAGYDTLTITDANGSSTAYSGRMLSNATIRLPGNHFTLRMQSDESNSLYGFRITNVTAVQYSSSRPESAHPYSNKMDQSWSYVHPTNAAFLKVSFSTDTELEYGYDYLSVIDSNGMESRYTGSQLSGTTLELPGNSFSLLLHTDFSETRYGFRITDIVPSSGATNPDYHSRSFRALLIGNNNYTDGPLSGCINDAHAMGNLLSGLANSFAVTTVEDAAAGDMTRAISSTFSGATENDVSLFYYSGHGLSSTDNWNGALCGVDGSFLKPSELASALSVVPGRVIVLLDCCQSGAVIGKTGVNEKEAMDAFIQSWQTAFAKYDRKIPVNSGDRSGELAESKFVVITACRSDQTSSETTSSDGETSGVFTRTFVTGCGLDYSSGSFTESIPADTDNNRALTVLELYSYTISSVCNSGYPQSAQCFATNMYENLFYR